MNRIPGVPAAEFETAEIMGALYGPGILGLKASFSREWVAQLREDIDVLYQEALKRPGGEA
ncbi:hypothetical protein KZ483_15380 [Paenibacillus sp. sptzw28]|uniref:hypothetical protein n=1 Tax=Paenibacillus sp. sptzw28 TaxID=715179 RepID=UPI001C6EDB53|nr:hypothetical protein [Paenibacillus sp. sptzw28]QYR19318.1 hypothetical protein KZ483_15380 [Paenibacillus sp. sptzw28]